MPPLDLLHVLSTGNRAGGGWGFAWWHAGDAEGKFEVQHDAAHPSITIHHPIKHSLYHLTHLEAEPCAVAFAVAFFLQLTLPRHLTVAYNPCPANSTSTHSIVPKVPHASFLKPRLPHPHGDKW